MKKYSLKNENSFKRLENLSFVKFGFNLKQLGLFLWCDFPSLPNQINQWLLFPPIGMNHTWVRLGGGVVRAVVHSYQICGC